MNKKALPDKTENRFKPMTTKKALTIACKNSAFLKHYNNVLNNVKTGCVLFQINDETFYCGFDGTEIMTGKHSAKKKFIFNSA